MTRPAPRSNALAPLAVVAVVAGLVALFVAHPARAAGPRYVPACVDVSNDTPYWMPGALWVQNIGPVGVRFDANQTTHACMDGVMPPDMTMEVIVKSGWGLPIGECHILPGGRMRIERGPDNHGKVETRLICF